MFCRPKPVGMRLYNEDIRVTLLESRDIKPSEHVYVKVQGVTTPAITDAGAPAAEQRRQRMKTARGRNASVVVECASVTIQ